MPVRRIVQYGEPVLKQKAKKIHRVDTSVQRLVDDLVDTVEAAHGAGLAAPQIGVPLRAIVTYVEENLQIVLNPEIVEASDEEIEAEEGCLSMPGWWGPVKRKVRVTVRGMNRRGKTIKIKADGWEARALQHEVDHLNGILFIDRMEDRRKLHRAESEEEEEELEEEKLFA